MISNLWIGKRKFYWDRMAVLIDKTDSGGVKSLSREELREMAMLYRQIASDLSAVRQDRTAQTLESNLNLLLARAHNIVYSARKGSLGSVVRFLRDDYPILFRRLFPFTLVSLTVFLGGCLIGVLVSLVRPAFVNALLGPAMVQTIQRHQMWTHSVSSMAPQASSAILTNNLSVIFVAFAAGITAGLGTLFIIGWNGVLIGVIGTACHLGKMSLLLWSFVAPHGSARAAIDPDRRRRRAQVGLWPSVSRNVQPQILDRSGRSRIGPPDRRLNTVADHCRNAGGIFLAIGGADCPEVPGGGNPFLVARALAFLFVLLDREIPRPRHDPKRATNPSSLASPRSPFITYADFNIGSLCEEPDYVNWM